MTDPQETSENIAAASGSAGEPDPMHERDTGGSDVGGPAAATESTAENALTSDSSVDPDESPDDQAANPL